VLVYGSLNYYWQLQDQPDRKKDTRMERTKKVKVEVWGGGGIK
jgi:hypothetical protein